MAGTPIIVAALGLALVSALPAASADAVALRTSQPVELDADLVATFPAGQVTAVHAAPFDGQAIVEGATGVLRVHAWSAVRVRGAVEAMYPTGDVRTQSFALENATIVIRFANENFAFAAVASEGGALAARARVDAEGSHAVVPRAPPPGGASVAVPARPRAVPDVEPMWEAGWHFAGRYGFAAKSVTGLPFADAHLDMRGPVAWKLHGGTLTFVDAEGVRRELWTGDRTALGHGENGTQEWRRAIFEGEVARATLPLGDRWGLAGPTVAWSLEGDATWRDADGWVEVAGRRTHVEGARVDVRGSLALLPALEEGVLAERARYEGTGTVVRASVDGEPLRVRGPGAPIAPAIGIAAIAASLALLWRFLPLLYTRLTQSDILSHPTRSRMLDVVRATPGIHLRELQRQVGGAWGPFMFHIGVLQKEGLVVVERHGRYLGVLIAGTEPPERAIHHPLARRIYESLPEDGSSRTLTDIAALVGASRALVAYHVRQLTGSRRIAVHGDGPLRAAQRVLADDRG